MKERKDYMSEEYDIRFLNILNSYNDIKRLADVIVLLKNEYVLNDDELEICDKCLADIEAYNGSHLKKILNIDPTIEIYEKLKIDDKIDEFIHDRKYLEVKDIFSLSTEDVFAPDSIEKLLKGYTKRIKSSIDYDLFNEDIFTKESDDIDISAISDDIDSFSKGIRRGTITTIVGDSSLFKSLWAINIAYDAVVRDKNVMYLSINTSKEIQAKRFLTRHNCNEKFPNDYTYESMHNKSNVTFTTNVVLDFKERYASNIIIFDESDLCIPTISSLRRLIAQAEKCFLDNTDSGIDLIIIDDLTYLSYYNNKQFISARPTVIGQYYKFLKDESKNLLGTNHGCSVLCTHQDIDDGVSAVKNNGNYKLSFINQTIAASSDNIFTIYGSPLMCSTKAKVKVIKAPYGEVMDRPKSIAIDYSKWFMSNNDSSLREFKYLVDLQKNQIKDLKTTLNTVIEQRDNAEGLLNEYRKRETDPFSGDEDNLWHGIISEEESYAFRQQLSNNEYNKEENDNE